EVERGAAGGSTRPHLSRSAGTLSRTEFRHRFARTADWRDVRDRSGSLARLAAFGGLSGELYALCFPGRGPRRPDGLARTPSTHARAARAGGESAHLSERLVRLGAQQARDLVSLRTGR